MKKISILDYKMNNLFSIKNALDYLGYNSVITSDVDTINNSDILILPGVGAFPVAMDNLIKLNLVNVIINFAKSGNVGICLGMQLLFESSNEFVAREGLGILKGEVKSLDSNLKSSRIPHVGWNKVNCNKKENFMSDELYDRFFYFVHSFFSTLKTKKK